MIQNMNIDSYSESIDASHTNSLLFNVGNVSGPTEHYKFLRRPSESSDTVYSELTLVTHQGKCRFTIHKEPLKTASRSIEILRI